MDDFNKIAKKCAEGKLFGTFVIECIDEKRIIYLDHSYIRKNDSNRYPFSILNSEKRTGYINERLADFNNNMSQLNSFRIVCFLENIFIE